MAKGGDLAVGGEEALGAQVAHRCAPPVEAEALNLDWLGERLFHPPRPCSR